MSLWRYRLQRASFRGVNFHLAGHDAELGRRNAVHEYPLRDVPYVEDLGRRGRRFRVEGFILGDFYFSDRDRLIHALEAGGPGELVHPYLGRMIVAVDQFRVTESSAGGGSAQFDISFLETDANQYPSAEKSWASEFSDWVDTTLETCENAFAEAWSIVDQGSEVIDAALALVGGSVALVGGAISQVNQLLAVPSRLSAVVRDLAALGSSAQALVQTPSTLASDVTGTLSSLGAAFDWGTGRYSTATQQVQTAPGARPTTPARQEEDAAAAAALVSTNQDSVARTLQTVQNWPATLDPVPTAAPSQQATNQAAFGALLTQAALVEECRLSLWRTFDSAAAAATCRDDLADRLDTAALAAGDDNVYEAMTGLRVVLVQALTARAASLASIVSYTPPDTLPALVLAWRLYDDARQNRDIIARNRLIIRHPGFVPGGVPLEVRSA